MVQIMVNGQKVSLDSDSVTHAEVAAMAYNIMQLCTKITYGDNEELLLGGSVKVTEGMEFNVSYNNSTLV